MSFFIKNIALFFFGNLLNGTIFAERERERERERETRNGRFSKTAGTLRAAFWRVHTSTRGYIPLPYIIPTVLLPGNAVVFF